VAAVILGEKADDLVPRLIAAGADKVYVAEHPLLREFLPFPFRKTMAALIEQYQPQIILFGATPLGRELAPRIAYVVRAGLTADCTGLEIGDHALGKDVFTAGLKQTRPALGGNIMATIMTKDSRFQMATVRPGVFPASRPDPARAGETIRFAPALDQGDIRSKIVAREPVVHQVHLEHAQILVSCGRGIGCRAEVEKSLKPLSEALGCWLKGKAEVSGSRMAVEDGLIGHERQVGQTGQTVAPRLYVAVGISGAVQHITGMQNSAVIVAVNKDANARIFRYADYGLIGSFDEIVPSLTEAVRKRCA
jgi:electron transfer flavoprotein alpha subunit